MLRFERRHEPLAHPLVFLGRMLRSSLLSAGIILGSLLIGMVGYHLTADLDWLDALLNASMILSGMGPVSTLSSPGAKLFASFYALYAGVVFLVAAGVFVAPAVHRLLHHLHLEPDEPGGDW
jgi:hypothetical protein